MTSSFDLDPSLFESDAIDAETAALNAAIVSRLADFDIWSLPAQEIRAMRERGEGPFPLAEKSKEARWITIDGPGGDLRLRILAPENPKGIYLHFHGGGWTFGAADHQDSRHERLAAKCRLATVSVEYRLAPEHPFPAE